MSPIQPLNIFGLGLAGVVLAWSGILRGMPVSLHAEAQDRPGTGFRAALGLLNPLVGPRFNGAWPGPENWPGILDFYHKVSHLLGQSSGGPHFFKETPIYRPFLSLRHREDFFHKWEGDPLRSPFIEAVAQGPSWGGVWIRHGALLDMPGFVEASRKWFEKEGLVQWGTVPSITEFLQSDSTGPGVWCLGTGLMDEPVLSPIPFQAVKGETLELLVHDELGSDVFSADLTLAVVGERIWAGATHQWDCRDPSITLQGREELLSKAGKWLSGPLEVTNQSCGIRCAVKDHFPVAGFLSGTPRVGVLGGLGGRGGACAPVLAEGIWDLLEKAIPMDGRLDVIRFGPWSF